MRILIIFFIFNLFSPLVMAERKAMLVLDASGSMMGQINGKAKITIAREVIDDMLKSWNPENQIGLVSYGHRKKGDCSDIETLIPVSKLDVNAFNKVVNSLTPKGKTPLSAAVRIAAEKLRHVEDAATVILISDGEETCNADPCAVASELEKTGVDFTVHVIGFDITEKKAVSQLQCLAKNTGGEYFPASDASALKEALTTAVKKVETKPEPKPEPTVDLKAPVALSINAVLAEGGKSVGGNDFRVYREENDEFGKPKRVQVARDYYKEGVRFMLPPGDYIAVSYLGNAVAESPVTIEPGKALAKTLIYNAARVKINAVFSEGQKKVGGNDIRVYREDADEFGKPKRTQVARDYYKEEVVFTIPEGNYIAASYLGSAYAEAELVVEAGKGQELQLNYKAARVKLDAALAAGSKPVGGNDIRIYREDKDEFGKPKRIQVARDYYKQEVIFTLPEGPYIAASYLGSAYTEKPIVVKAGKSMADTLVYNAGRLKMTAVQQAGGEHVGNNDFRVYREEKDEFGNSKRIQIARDYYKTEVVFTVPVGDYLLEAINGNAKGNSKITIQPGQMTESELILEKVN